MRFRKMASGMMCVALAVCMTACGKEDSYRVIKLVEATGEVTYTRDDKEEKVYENMNFENGDAVETGKESAAKLSLDGDKYLYMGADTSIEMEATGNEKDNRTVIELISGEISNDIQKELSDKSLYEIKTSNATIGVHGTIFYVKEDGDKTIVYCEEGEVKVETEDDTKTIKEKEAVVVEDDTITETSVDDFVMEISENCAGVMKNIVDLQENGVSYPKPGGEPFKINCTYCHEEDCYTTVYVPEGYTIKTYGDQTDDTNWNVNLRREFENGYFESITVSPSVYKWVADYLRDGTVADPERFGNHQIEVIELEPVAGGHKCYMYHETYDDLEYDLKQQEYWCVAMEYTNCEGEVQFFEIRIISTFVESYTKAYFQSLAYAIYGK